VKDKIIERIVFNSPGPRFKDVDLSFKAEGFQGSMPLEARLLEVGKVVKDGVNLEYQVIKLFFPLKKEAPR
jgi:hypothetical protein